MNFTQRTIKPRTYIWHQSHISRLSFIVCSVGNFVFGGRAYIISWSGTERTRYANSFITPIYKISENRIV